MKLKLIAASVALALANPLLAADGVLDEVVVTAPKAKPENAVDMSALRALRPATSDSASLLRDVPGVSLYQAGGVSSLPAIRGLADDRIRTKLDGMDLISSCPNHMNPPLSYVAPSQLAALEVYAGVSPVSTGGDSIAGTIVANTPLPEFAAPGQKNISTGEVGAFYRSNNQARGGNVAATYATEQFNINYSGAYSKADNYRAGGNFKSSTATGRPGHTLALDRVGSTAYESQNHTLGMAYKNAAHLFEGKVGYQDMPFQNYPNQRMDLLGNTEKRANVRYRGTLDWGVLETRIYHEDVKHRMNFGEDKRFWYGTASGAGLPCTPLGPTCAAGMQMNTDGKTTGASLKAELPLFAHDLLRAGMELQRYRMDDYWPATGGMMWPGTFYNIQDGKRDRKALYAEWETRPDSQWMALFGSRYEQVNMNAGAASGYNPTTNMNGSNQQRDAAAFNARTHKQTDNNIDLTALARYAASAELDVELGAARKVRSPNVYERYTWSTWSMAAVMNNLKGDGNGYFGNPDLKPEQAHTVSVTLDWHASDLGWQLKATPFYTRVNDYIDAVRGDQATPPAAVAFVPGQFNVLQYANQDARLYGVDVSGHASLGHTAWGGWGVQGVLNYTDGKNMDTGDDLYNTLPLNARFTLTQHAGGWDNKAEWVLVAAKDRVSDIHRELQTPGYGLLNLRASYTWQQLRIDFGVENVLDKFYSLPTGGAYVGQGGTMGINDIPSNIAVPGMGRSPYTGVNYTF
ncbi:TonB-dependent receptor [Ferrigenium sp. UT5]|uniref:TonB-dependent receptor n=1 Tax=Ferrigenium sp. UT5 TaxID=3242105 RepID=UPI00354B6061